MGKIGVQMKKLLASLLIVSILFCVALLPADQLRTKVGSYQLIMTSLAGATETSPATTDFNLRSSDQTLAFDLMSIGNAVGGVTEANGAVFIVAATASNNDTATIEYWGISDNVPLEKICSVAYIFGTAEKSTGVLWADTVTVTDKHTNTVKTGGSAENGVARVLFDMTGYRYIRPFVRAKSGTTNTYVYVRFF